MYGVYVIECIPTGRRYVGYSKDPAARFAAHARKPPSRMQQDAAAHPPFREHFSVTVLEWTPSECCAKQREMHYINLWNTCRPNGYNILPACPGKNQAFWAMHYRGTLPGKKRS
jgi:hypothetical protein